MDGTAVVPVCNRTVPPIRAQKIWNRMFFIPKPQGKKDYSEMALPQPALLYTSPLCSPSGSGMLQGMLPNRLWRFLSKETVEGGISVNGELMNLPQVAAFNMTWGSWQFACPGSLCRGWLTDLHLPFV